MKLRKICQINSEKVTNIMIDKKEIRAYNNDDNGEG